MRPELLGEGLHALQSITQVLKLCRVDHEHFDLAVVTLGDCKAEIWVFVVKVILAAVVLLRSQLALCQNPGKQVRHDGQELLLERRAQPLSRCHDIFLDGVVLGQVGHGARLNHGLHDNLGVWPEGLTAHDVCQQRDAFESLPQQLALLRLVKSRADDLLEHGHQRRVVLGEAVLDLPSDHGDASDGLALELGGLALQPGPQAAHERLHERLERLALGLLPEVVEGLHAGGGDARALVVEALDELRQQHAAQLVARHGVLLVYAELLQRPPRAVAGAHVGGLQLHVHGREHLLGGGLIVDVLAALRQRGEARDVALPVCLL
mmetsp:Transcript_72430/g.195855  ORF Transcript_72430/g.195855 Transcript_72430/m.195855 type:complete len:321 (+) Transcript_72430:1571-2533(+)